MDALDRVPEWLRTVVVVALVLLTSALAVGALEATIGIDNASSLFLVAVSIVALSLGTWPAVVTAIGSFLAYNFFFVDPRLTFTVSRAGELLTLVLLLFVGIVISRLAGLQRQREQESARREREARALFAVSRELVRSEGLADAMQVVCERLAAEAGMSRVWVGIGPTAASERVAADSGAGTPPSTRGAHLILQRDAAEAASSWMRIHPPAAPRTEVEPGGPTYRVELKGDHGAIGSLWGQRPGPDPPHLEETRLLAAAADQLGAAIWREDLRTKAAELEIARRSDELKSALVDSVSHDLRTPLATIRVAAGTLADPDLDLPPRERRSVAAAIDQEAERLNRLVGDLLDMSRIQGGALIPEIEIYPLSELVAPAVERASAAAGGRPVKVDVPADVPLVRVDAVLLDRILTNLLDNATKHAGQSAPIRVRAAASAEETVALTVEDGGPGIPDAALGQVFERGQRAGMGLGLVIVRGLADAMGARVTAARSELGGLAMTVSLPAEPAGNSL
jgi:two-component system sensor histidine kinase KdpD